MRELELKDIVAYLAYKLKAVCCKIVYEIKGVDIDAVMVKINLYEENADSEDWWNLSNFKPILRPLSDLYKTITHNGKEIVPIVELAKIATGKDDWYFSKSKNCAELDEDYDYFRFNFDIIDKSFESRLRVKRQHQLFDFLHEIKIDYRGLIDSGLAVSVYDLKENPYK